MTALVATVLTAVAVGVFAFTGKEESSGIAAATPKATTEQPKADTPRNEDGEAFENAEPLPEPSDVETPAATPENKPSPPKISPPKKSEQGGSAGCSVEYGPAGTCVPTAFPGYLRTLEDKCAFLASYGMKKITVTGADRLGLDPDKNGVACD